MDNTTIKIVTIENIQKAKRDSQKILDLLKGQPNNPAIQYYSAKLNIRSKEYHCGYIQALNDILYDEIE